MIDRPLFRPRLSYTSGLPLSLGEQKMRRDESSTRLFEIAADSKSSGKLGGVDVDVPTLVLLFFTVHVLQLLHST